MKKVTYALGILIATLSLSTAAKSEQGRTIYNSNFRAEPSTESTIHSVIPASTSVNIIGYEDGWLQIYHNDTYGWIFRNLVETANDKIVENSSDNFSQPAFEEKLTYAGEFKLTGYCPCRTCSEGWGRKTTSGATATAGTTVATSKKFSLGTKLYIEGVGYRIVQDRGGAIKGNKIDVFVDNHSECYADNINTKAKVWIVE